MSNIKVYLRIKPSVQVPSDPDEQNRQPNSGYQTPFAKTPFRPAHEFKICPTKLGKSLAIKSDKKHFNDRRFEFEEIFEPHIGQAELFAQFQERILESATNGVS